MHTDMLPPNPLQIDIPDKTRGEYTITAEQLLRTDQRVIKYAEFLLEEMIKRHGTKVTLERYDDHRGNIILKWYPTDEGRVPPKVREDWDHIFFTDFQKGYYEARARFNDGPHF